MSDPAPPYPPGVPLTPRASSEPLGRPTAPLGAPVPPPPAPAGGNGGVGGTGAGGGRAEPPYIESPPPGPDRPAAAKSKPSSSGLRVAVEWVVIIAAALLVAVVVKTFLIQAFFIPSGSMEPTLMVGDRVLVNKLSYHLHPIHRGDIVVFKSPPTETDPNVKDLIKRVIGLPGDQIEAMNGHVFINGKQLNESYLPAGTLTTNLPLMTVPTGEYYMLGDNRGDSKDSRYLGPIPRKLIVGRAFIRVWPLSKIGLL